MPHAKNRRCYNPAMPSLSSRLPTVHTAEAPRLSKRIVGLDALRMIAACIVVVGHLTYVIWLEQPHPPPTSLLTRPFIWFGWVGVEIFFVLSGFVIASAAYGFALSDARTAAHTIFLHHRLKRLVPAAFICSTFTAIILLLTGAMPKYRVALSWVRTMSLLPQGPWPILHIPLIDISYWTLTLEAIFYSLVYLLLRLRRIDKLPTVMAILGGLSSIHWIVFFLLHRHDGGPRPWLYPSPLRALAQMTLMVNGCYFAIGVFLWLCLFQGVTWKRIAILALCIAGGVLQIVQRWNVFYGIPATFRVMLWFLALVVIVACSIFNRRVQLALGHRGAAILRRIGLMTYPLYLIHFEFSKRLILAIRGSVGDWSAAALAMASSLILAYLVSKFLEPPTQRILWNFMTRGSHTGVATSLASNT